MINAENTPAYRPCQSLPDLSHPSDSSDLSQPSDSFDSSDLSDQISCN